MPIDVHAHYVPRQLLSAVESEGADIGVRLVQRNGGDSPAIAFDSGFSTRALFPKLVEPADARRESLDRQGLDRQIVATWPDMHGYGLETSKCLAWHRILNSTLAEWAHGNADRFSWMASVPVISGNAAADELVRAVDDGAVAAMLPANVEGVNIEELPLDPFWSAADRLAIAVALHPVSTVAAPRAAKFGLNPIVQYTFDTTLGVGSILFSGLLDRFPRLKLILSHGGGAFPYLAGRFDLIASRMDLRTQGATSLQAPSFYMRSMAYDTVVYEPKTLRFLADTVGLEQLVIGTDEAFPATDVDPLSNLMAAGFSDAERRVIGDENPRRLMPRLR